jgi:hypothetical protein
MTPAAINETEVVVSTIREAAELQRKEGNSVFSTVWNQNSEKDILYICVGPLYLCRTRR